MPRKTSLSLKPVAAQRDNSPVPIERALETAAQERTAATTAQLLKDARDKLAGCFLPPRWEWVKRRARMTRKAGNDEEFDGLCVACLGVAAMSHPDNAAAALCLAAKFMIIQVGGQPNERDDARLQEALSTGVVPPVEGRLNAEQGTLNSEEGMPNSEVPEGPRSA